MMRQKRKHKKILVIVSYEKGRGTGHLVRGSELVRALRKMGDDAALVLRTGEGRSLAEMGAAALAAGLTIQENEIRAMDWDCIIFDRFETPPSEFDACYPLSPLIAIDEGGAMRDSFDFVIDLLPNLPHLPAANSTRPDLLPLPQNRRGSWRQGNIPKHILIAFGGEDAAGLGIKAAFALHSALPDAAITLVTNNADDAPAGVTVYPRIENLREKLASYDVVITHYGLTAFEAVYARCSALLVSPSALHEKLAKNAGFFSAGLKETGLLVLKEQGGNEDFWQKAQDASRAVPARRHLENETAVSLAGYIHSLDISAFHVCPVCGSPMPSKRKTIARFAEQTFVECPHCSMIIQYRLSLPPIEYNEGYFFEMYQKQYGKTYLDDFPHLKEMARARLVIIKKLLRHTPEKDGAVRLLDIGCAYGAFLAAARDAGFDGTGIDVSPAAAAYTSGKLGIPAFAADFPAGAVLSGGFDCLTMWFVIEHLQDVPAALAKTRELLGKNGIFAFSTPSGSGISARKPDLHGKPSHFAPSSKFLAASPTDHWSIWKPAACRRLLAHFGFRVKKIRITGHHPERFPGAGAFVKKHKTLYYIILAVSKLFRLGDTFEVYAEKND
ncbi:MAG: methyltransferase domain-containing protein [Spirochaetaceae bacterium]|jgi:2-polyprenyl-3-methyl-5-hydroxy-6-metoxy-1,4-benzoquinol methylase/spore coat polysaccharide biosynthesis predicted glycosyltransferase SpsG|nr:methyltransferase domain-containing protein [Spirochaetaceae bacterium]